MRPMVFSPYLRRLECLKAAHSQSVISRPWVLVRPGFEPITSHLAHQCLSNQAKRAAVCSIKLSNNSTMKIIFSLLSYRLKLMKNLESFSLRSCSCFSCNSLWRWYCWINSSVSSSSSFKSSFSLWSSSYISKMRTNKQKRKGHRWMK